MKILVYLDSKSSVRLANSHIKSYFIFKVNGNSFLVAKSQSKQIQHQIGFMYAEQSFYCTFSRHIHLTYSNKLEKLMHNLRVKGEANLHNQWLMLYEIHNFKIWQKSQNNTSPIEVEIAHPAYGDMVNILDDSKAYLKQISSAFKEEDKNYYFIDSESEVESISTFSFIFSLDMKCILGVIVRRGAINICMPFQYILSQKNFPFLINQKILPLLQQTCYILFHGFYSTGIFISFNSLISAKHLLPIANQKLNTIVGIRRYPYHKLQKGKIVKVGLKSLDLMQIHLIQEENNNQPIANRNTSQPQSTTRQLGDQIQAIGFGKYAYDDCIFQKWQIVLPTIQRGIISKVIKINEQPTFIKTDANLYNGYSGCGIWQDAQLIGMAIFILKNKSNSLNYNNHNYSYMVEYIEQEFLEGGKTHITASNDDDLAAFDKITMRTALKPKL